MSRNEVFSQRMRRDEWRKPCLMCSVQAADWCKQCVSFILLGFICCSSAGLSQISSVPVTRLVHGLTKMWWCTVKRAIFIQLST